jgi:hypothetical protein
MIGTPITPELLRAITADKEREARKMLRAREVCQEQGTPTGRARAWAWSIEPGMEDAFQSLREWLLSSVGHSDVSSTASGPVRTAP